VSRRTIYLSRLLGLFIVIVSAGEITQRATLVDIANDFVAAPALLLISGMLTLLAGLAIVLAHNVWRGGALPVVVTILGWLMLLKGATLLVLPPARWAGVVQAAHYADLYPLYVGIALLVGVYLTVAGFSARNPGHDEKW
jgi:hypothetical protein